MSSDHLSYPCAVPGCCPIHDNLVKPWRTSSSPCSCYPAILLLVSVCVCAGGGGDENDFSLVFNSIPYGLSKSKMIVS